MKKDFSTVSKAVLFMLAVLLGFTGKKAIAQEPENYLSYNDFYENLAPYGHWINDPKYGYMWSPEVGGEFRPYFTNGHWAVTQYGNTWISDYAWGWACFHYGRWTFDSYYGWLWIPGSVWGPAWVMWRSGTGFYGWAPLEPSFKLKPKAPEQYVCPRDWWVFIPPQYLYSGNYYSYWSGPTGKSSIFKHTTQINNMLEVNKKIIYVIGPYASQIEKITHKQVGIFHIVESANLTTRTHLDEIKMFRHETINQLTVLGEKPVPAVVVPNTKPVAENPELLNDLQGEPVPQFRLDLAKKPPAIVNPVVTPAANQNHRPIPTSKPMAPQSPDIVPYDWQNPVPQQQPASVEYKLPPQTHPDHGPVQHPDPLPVPKDSLKKKLPSQGSQTPEQVKHDDQMWKK